MHTLSGPGGRVHASVFRKYVRRRAAALSGCCCRRPRRHDDDATSSAGRCGKMAAGGAVRRDGAVRVLLRRQPGVRRLLPVSPEHLHVLL